MVACVRGKGGRQGLAGLGGDREHGGVCSGGVGLSLPVGAKARLILAL